VHTSRTLGDLLNQLAEREQYQREMRRADDAMERMRREDAVAWAQYLSELHTFDAGTTRDRLTAPGPGRPECNDQGSPPGALSGR
jgi:hypothetical protein